MKINVLSSEIKETSTVSGEGVITPTQDDCKQEDIDFLNRLLGKNPHKEQFTDLLSSMDSETFESISKDIFPSMTNDEVSEAVTSFASQLKPDASSKKNVYQQIIGKLAQNDRKPNGNTLSTVGDNIVKGTIGLEKKVEDKLSKDSSLDPTPIGKPTQLESKTFDKVVREVSQSKDKNQDSFFDPARDENKQEIVNIVAEKKETKSVLTDTTSALEEPLVQPLVNVTPVNIENTMVVASPTTLPAHSIELAQQIKDQMIDRILVSSSDLNDNREVVLKLNPSLLAETQVSFQKVGQSLQVQFVSPNTESLKFLSVYQLDLQGYLQDELKNFRGISVRIQQQGNTDMGQPHDGRSRNPYEYQDLNDDDNDPSSIA